MEHGCVAVAMVQRQVMVVQASRSHNSRDAWLDVHTFIPFGNNVFLPSPVPQARIPSSDVLTVFSMNDKISSEKVSSSEMLEISPRAYMEFIALSSRMHKKYERLFDVWSRKSRR